MQIAAVAVSATDLSRAVAFYEGLGFRFPPLEAGTQHIEAEAGVRLMIDDAGLLEGLHGEPPQPGNTAGFAVLFDSPAEDDDAPRRAAGGGGRVGRQRRAGAVRRAVGAALRDRGRPRWLAGRPLLPAGLAPRPFS